MEATKDAADKVNRKTSDAALRGIEKGGMLLGWNLPFFFFFFFFFQVPS